MVAVAVIGSGIIGAGANIISSHDAAKAQTQAADKASDTQLQMFNIAQQNLAPYNQAGQAAEAAYTQAVPDLIKPINMDQATLEATPGYKFNLDQGLKSVQNSAAARGLASSGAALKGAATYATGLADSTYQQQFQNAFDQKKFAANTLLAPVQIGESAAAGTGTAAVNTGAGIASNTLGAGNATAARDVATGNAIASGAGSVGNLYLTNALMKGMYGGSGIFGSGGGSGMSAAVSDI